MQFRSLKDLITAEVCVMQKSYCRLMHDVSSHVEYRVRKSFAIKDASSLSYFFLFFFFFFLHLRLQLYMD